MSSNETVEGESVVEDEDTGSYENLDPDACPGVVYGQNQSEGGVPRESWGNRVKPDAVAEQNQSDCMVAKDGAIIGEWYWNNTEPFDKVKSWSVGNPMRQQQLGWPTTKIHREYRPISG